MSVESVWEDAAYFAALVEYLCIHKDDETDAEVAEFIKAKPWLTAVLVNVLLCHEAP